MLHNIVHDHGTDVVVSITAAEFSRASFRAMSGPFEIVVNGETRTVEPGATVAGQVGRMGFGGRRGGGAGRRGAGGRGRGGGPRARRAAAGRAAGGRRERGAGGGGGGTPGK